jgi:hypothetical protein
LSRVLKNGVDNSEEGEKRRNKKKLKSYNPQGKGKRILEVEEGMGMNPKLEKILESL